jgi:hypothetical protein
MTSFRGIFLIAGLLALSAVPALLGQSAGTGALTGTVTDPSGAIVPNVTVTLTNPETGQERTATTGADGAYRFSLLPPGTYKIRFTATGFKTSEVPSVTVNVTETPVLNRTLEVGGQAETISVEAEAGVLQTADSTLGTTVGSRTVTELPLATRNFTQIIGLSAGASMGVNNAVQFGKGTLDMSVNGNDPGQNNFQMDGVAVNNMANLGSANDAGIYGGIGIPSPDALQEFKIQTSTYDASYGRNPGANVNVVTKSGTNQFHGTAFEFFRNAQLNANDFFYNRDNPNSRTAKQILNQNQFGGVLGGPVKKDKIFFFGSYQGTRSRNAVAPQGNSSELLPGIPDGDRTSQAFVSQLIADNCHFLDFGAFPALPCSATSVSPQALKILQLKNADGSYYIPSTSGMITQRSFSIPAVFREDQMVTNGDYLLNSKNTLAMRYFYSRDPRTAPFYSIIGGGLPGAPQDGLYTNHAAALKLTTLVTSSFVNEARVSFQRIFAQLSDVLPAGSTPQNLGITPMIPTQTQAPTLAFLTNGFTLFGSLDPTYSPTDQIQFSDQISWSHGKHTIRAGFEVEFAQWNLVFGGLGRGWLLMGSFNDLLYGGPGSIATCLFCVKSGPDGIIHAYRERNLNSYVQDDWKVNSKLTLNLGVRWEYDGTFSDKYGNLTNTWPSQLAPNSQVPTSAQGLPANYAGWVTAGNYLDHYPQPPNGVLINKSGTGPIQEHPPLSNFGPRIGFAYQAASKLVIRGGAGLFYDRIGADRFVHALEQGNPYAVTLDYSGAAAASFTIANPFPDIPLGGFAQRFNNPTAACLANPTPILATCTSNLNVPFLNQIIHTPTVRQYNVNFQYEFAPSWVLEMGYVGSSAINLVDYNHNYNTAQMATASNPVNGITTTTAANTLFRVPYVGYQPIGLQGTAFDGISFYNSLQITVRKQLSHGLTLQGAYTWSKSLTDIGPSATANSNNASDLAQQYGPAYFNRPQRFIINYSWDLPLGKHSGFLGGLLGGWNVSGVTTIQNGTPLSFNDPGAGTAFGTQGSSSTPQSGWGRAQIASGMTYADIATPGGIESRLGGNSGGPGYFNLKAFAPAPAIMPDGVTVTSQAACSSCATLFGNSGMGILLGPGQFNFDASLLKTTRITEHQSVQFRAEFFNILDHPQFSNPGSSTAVAPFYLPQVNSSPSGNWITSTSVNPRILQLALKYIF